MKNITRLKIELLCKGLKVNPNEKYYADIVPEKYAEGGKSRAGIAGSGKSFILDYGETCNIGVLQPFLEESPFEYKIIDNEGWILKNGRKIIKATLRKPQWHSTPLFNEIQLHGKDSLATALFNFCIYKDQEQGCKFCIIDIGKEIIFRNSVKIAESIEEIEKNQDLRACFDIEDKYNLDLTREELLGRKKYIEPKDININAGTLKNTAKIYQNAISQIRKISKLPIYIQICPIRKEEIETLYLTGLDEISFNIEVYDENARREVIPGKAKDHSLDDCLNAMRNASEILGANHVSSWILIGLEPADKTIEGIKAIAETGAIPVPKPFRPLYNADYQRKKPPTVEDVILIYEEWLDIIKEYGLNPLKAKAGCVMCNGCFPIRELLKYGI